MYTSNLTGRHLYLIITIVLLLPLHIFAQQTTDYQIKSGYIYNFQKFADNKDRKEKTYAMIQRFSHKFKSAHTVMDCKTLMGCDLNTEEGQKYVADNNLHEKVCERCIADAIKIVDEMIQE